MKKNFFDVNAIHSLWVAGIMMCACTLGLFSCSDEYDDSELRNTIEDLGDRVATLEEWQKSVNTSIESLQSLVSALENRDYITDVTPVTEGGEEVGYTITFQNGDPITIRHGKNGADGTSPVVGVAQDTDGKYYWTLNGDFIKDDNGNKIPVTGEEGTTAIAPQVRINSSSNEWEISNDGGKTWTSTGVKATGETGATGSTGPKGDKGDKGDSMFSNIDTNNPNEVVFTLANGTKISVPRISEVLNIMENGSDNGFTVTSELLKAGTGNVVHVRVESPNADGVYIETRSIADGTRWKITSSTTDNTMTILAYPAEGVEEKETALLMVTVSDSKGNTLAKGQKVFTNLIKGGTAEVVEDATELTTALNNSEVTLVALAGDVILTEELSVSGTKTIDLNDRALSSSKDITAMGSGKLILKGGKITQSDGKAIVAQSNSTVELDQVNYEGDGWSCIFSKENATDTHIFIRNSTIKGGYYAITTNASTNPVGSTTIELENSTFEAAETAMLVNIPATITVKNCTFTGGWQGIFLRGGTATFEDSHINLVMSPAYNDVPEDHKNVDNTWKDGNQAEGAALLIGNRGTDNSTAYNYSTTVTLKNTTFSVTGTAKSSKTTREAKDTPSVYIWSRVEEGKGTSFNYDKASENSFKAVGKGLYIGNEGKNLKVNGNVYVAPEKETN